MSLHKFAEQVAANGRGDDSLLVHMTPDEVRNLQKFAEANGTTLTINPDTGLPEAGLLSDLFKAVAPIALGAFLGPAGAAFGGGLMSAGMAGLTVGGITTLATGSLSRGLMAGLGAYGGAGLGESLMSAGTGAGMTEALAGSSTGNLGQAFGDVAATATDGSAGSAFNKFLTSNANPATMSASELASSGLKAAASDPLGFAKSNLTNIGMAAAPIMAGAMVPTTTKLPEARDSGLIRQMAFNINPDTGKPDPLYGMREMTPVKASEFGNKTFQGQRDLFYQQNPNPYELGVGSLNQPPQQQPARMNTGGIVALADGGEVKHYVIGGTVAADLEKAYAAKDYSKVQDIVSANQVSQADIQNQWKGLDTSGLAGLGVNLYNPEAEALFKQAGSWEGADKIRDDAANAANAAMWAKQAADRDAANLAASTSSGLKFATGQGQTADQYYSTIGNQFNELTGYGDKYANATDAQLDAAAKEAEIKYGISYADFMKGIGKSGGSLASQYAIGAGNMGLSGLNTNINDWLAKARLDPTFKAKTGLEQQQLALDAMKTVNMNEADVLRATGKTVAELFPSTLTKPITVIPGGTQLPGATVYDNGAYGNYGSGPATGVDYRGNTVSIATPGDIITNTDGTRTVVPNIPGRPYGGFTGSEQVKSRYTAGGGSLGYTAPIPKDPEATFNKMTDDSLDAYNFLMGKGKNLSQRTATADRPVMRRYDEGVLGRKIPKLTKPGTTTTKTDTKETVAGDTAVVSGVTFDLTDPTKAPAEDNNGPWSWDITSKRWVQYGKFADGGMTGYAMGGGLGSLGSYSDGGRLLKGPGDGVSDSIPATIGAKNQPARLADGEFVIPARIVSELGNGSTDAGAKKLYAMMDRVQRARGKTTGKNKVAANSRADKYLPA